MRQMFFIALTIAAFFGGQHFARADTLTITLTQPSGLCASGCTKTFSDAASATPNTLESNIVTVFQSGCNTSINGTCTPGQVLTYWATNLKNTFVAEVTAYQTQALTNSATNSYTPINPQ